MDVVNEVNEDHCLYIQPVTQHQDQSTKKELTSPWKRICDDNDENCIVECTVPKKGGTKFIQYKQSIWNSMKKLYTENWTAEQSTFYGIAMTYPDVCNVQ